MQCKNCGTNLVRGFSFCLECGLPVPDEMLEESGLPQRNIDSGPQESYSQNAPERAESAAFAETEEPGDLKPQLQGGGEEDRGAALKPQLVGGDAGIGGKDLKPKLMGLGEETSGNALKPKYVGGGDDDRGTGEQVKVVLQETSSETDNVVEKLVFCPNCGMRMQHNPNICDICGMLLGNKPTNVPKTSSGVPLFNTDGDVFAGGFGAGGFGGFGSGVEELSDDDASRVDNFISGKNDPLFNTSSPAGDLNALTEQLAGFSAAAGTRSIGVTENTRIRQTEPEKGMEREVSDFSMTDDLSSESVPMSDDGIPIVGDYSMEDNPNEYIDLDPYRFVGMSMDETPAEPIVKKASGLGAGFASLEPPTVPKAAEPALEAIAPETETRGPEPIAPQAAAGTVTKEPDIIQAESLPVIARETPIITEPTPDAAALENITAEASEAPAPATVPSPAAVEEEKAPEPTVQAENTVEQPPEEPKAAPVEAEKPAEQPSAESKTALSHAGSTKKCYACGHIMPAADKFCPNCGRSTFGAPNPNLTNRTSAQPPVPKKRSVLPFILIVLIAVAAAVAVTMFVMKGNAEAVGEEEQPEICMMTEDL